MARGGKRAGSGRKQGAATKRTRKVADEAAASGETPLEYMLRVMRDDATAGERRDDMAKAAAPYVHARLASMQLTGKDGGPIEHAVMTDAERFTSSIAAMSARSDDDKVLN